MLNLGVSFTISAFVALRAYNVQPTEQWKILRFIMSDALKSPLPFIVPKYGQNGEAEAEESETKNRKASDQPTIYAIVRAIQSGEFSGLCSPSSLTRTAGVVIVPTNRRVTVRSSGILCTCTHTQAVSLEATTSHTGQATSAAPRALLIGVITVLAITMAAQKQKDDASPNVDAAVRAVLDAQVAAWNHHDLEGFMAGYWNSPELTFFSGATETKGWEPTLERYRRSYQAEGTRHGYAVVQRPANRGAGPGRCVRSRQVPAGHA